MRLFIVISGTFYIVISGTSNKVSRCKNIVISGTLLRHFRNAITSFQEQ